MPSSEPSDRRARIAEAAVAILAEEGSRALTHRAIDRRLELPEGSTSAYFRTRAALVEAAVERITSLDLVLPPIPSKLTAEQAASSLAAVIERWLGDESRQIARAELLLEARRVPEIARSFEPARARFLDVSAKLLHALGAEADASAARALSAFVEGIVFERLLYPRTALRPKDLPRVLGRYFAGVSRA